MNLLKYPKIYLSLIALGVFVFLTLPKITFAQSDGSTDGSIENFLQGILWDILTMIGGFMVWFGGKLLNYAVTYYVVGFGNFFITSGLGDSVNSLWSIVRDVFNLTFIFGLVFIGFKLIFGDSSAKRALGTLIMAALLVNFSLFITKFVIDFSNIAAAQFASAFIIGTEYNLSEGFMRLFGLSGIFSTGNPLPATAGWTYIFLTFFLFVVAAFVFIAGGLMLIIRFVVLNLYMILSPIMFLGWVFPGFSGTSRQYWSGFLQRAFFAPDYLLMLYLSHQVLVNMRMSNGSTQKLNGIATNNSDAANAAFDQTIPLFLVSIIFLIASLIVAQKMGAQGATSAIAIGKRITGRAKQMAVNTAWGAGKAVGYGPAALSRKYAVNPLGSKLEKSLNNMQAGNGFAAKVAKTNVVDRFARGRATALQNAKLGTGTTNDAEDEYKAKTQSRANQTAAENDRSKKFSDNYDTVAGDVFKNGLKSTEQLSDAFDELGKTIKAMTKDEKIGLKDKLKNQHVAIHLSDDDFKNIEASGKYSSAEIQEFKDAKKAGLISIATHGNTFTKKNTDGTITYTHSNAGSINADGSRNVLVDKRQTLASKSAKETGSMPVDIFKQVEMYDHLSPSMLEERIKSGVSPADYPAIREAIENHLGVGRGQDPDRYPEQLDNNKWVKWIRSNSVHAANLF